jgi:hypothetical protein
MSFDKKRFRVLSERIKSTDHTADVFEFLDMCSDLVDGLSLCEICECVLVNDICENITCNACNLDPPDRKKLAIGIQIFNLYEECKETNDWARFESSALAICTSIL